ncbi:MAG: sialidase family protein [Solirubrobacteraceae bacterium]
MRPRSVVALVHSSLTLAAAPAQALPDLTPFSAAGATAGCSVAGTVKGYEVEPSLAADPTGEVVAAAWQQDRNTNYGGGSAANAVAVSTDHGVHWRRSIVEGVSACGGGASARISDPWVAVDPEGTVYVASEAVEPDAVVVQSSRDGGATWTSVQVAEEGDKETMAVDPETPGRAWVGWNSGLEFSVSRTDDYGATWSAPTSFGNGNVGQGFDIHLLPLTGGRLVAVESDGQSGGYNNFALVARSSDDAGRTWSPRSRLGIFRSLSLYTPEGQGFRADAVIFSAASAGNHAWVAVQGARRVAVFHSGDGGMTWRRRPLAKRGALVGTPTIAVSPDARKVVVSYLSLDRDRSGDRAVTARWRTLRSGDGGTTFRDTPLTRTFDARPAKTDGTIFLGDYTGLTALGYAGDFAALVVATHPLARAGLTDPLLARFHVG